MVGGAAFPLRPLICLAQHALCKLDSCTLYFATHTICGLDCEVSNLNRGRLAILIPREANLHPAIREGALRPIGRAQRTGIQKLASLAISAVLPDCSRRISVLLVLIGALEAGSTRRSGCEPEDHTFSEEACSLLCLSEHTFSGKGHTFLENVCSLSKKHVFA